MFRKYKIKSLKIKRIRKYSILITSKFINQSITMQSPYQNDSIIDDSVSSHNNRAQ